MIKSVAQGMLKSARGLAGALITTGKRTVVFAERLGADEAYDLRAPYAEIWMHDRGGNVMRARERLDSCVDRLSVKAG